MEKYWETKYRKMARLVIPTKIKIVLSKRKAVAKGISLKVDILLHWTMFRNLKWLYSKVTQERKYNRNNQINVNFNMFLIFFRCLWFIFFIKDGCAVWSNG